MALGDQAGLQAVNAAVAQLPGIEKFTDDERAQLTATMLQMWNQIPADLAPAVAQMAAFNENVADLKATVATVVGMFQQILDNGLLLKLGPKPSAPETPAVTS